VAFPQYLTHADVAKGVYALDAAQQAVLEADGWVEDDPPVDVADPLFRKLYTIDIGDLVPPLIEGLVPAEYLPAGIGSDYTDDDAAALWSTEDAVVYADGKLTIDFPAAGLDAEAIETLVAAIVQAGDGITATYVDGGEDGDGTVTIAVDDAWLVDQVATIFGGTHSGITVERVGDQLILTAESSAPADDSITQAMLQDGIVGAAKVDPDEIPVFDDEHALAVDDGASRDAGTAATHGDVDDLAATILGAVYAKYLARGIVVANADGTPVALQGASGTDAVPALVGDTWVMKPVTDFGTSGGTVVSVPNEQTIYTYPDRGRAWAAAVADAISPIPAVGVARLGITGDSVIEGLYGKPVAKLRARLGRFNGNGPLDPGWVNADTTTISTSTYQFGLTTGSAGASEGQTNFRRSIGPARYAYKLGSGSVLTLQDVANATAPVTVDAIEVVYIASGTAATGNLEVRAGGTLLGTITCYDGTLSTGVEKVRKVEYSVTKAKYSSITITGAGGNPATVVGVGLWCGAKIRAYNFGHTGTKYSDYKGNLDTDPAASMAAMGMDAVICAHGINDYTDGLATLQSNMSSFLLQVATKNPGVSLGVLIPYGTLTRADWRSTFATGMRATANSLLIGVADASWMVDPNAGTDPRDLVANVDNVHLNASGGELYAGLLARFLLGDDIDWTKVPNNSNGVTLSETTLAAGVPDAAIVQARDNAGTTELVAVMPDSSVVVLGPAAPSVKVTGLAGATDTPITLAGGHASGAPTSGTHAKGEIVFDDTGVLYYCTVAGSPGTWVTGAAVTASSFIVPALLASDGPSFRGLVGSAPTTAVKEPVRAVAYTNGTLSTAYENGDTVDGVTLATGDRILLAAQTTGSENGIYTVNASGAPTRAVDFDASSEVAGGLTVDVREGTAFGGRKFRLTNTAAVTLGTTALTFAVVPNGAELGYAETSTTKTTTNTGSPVADKISGLSLTVVGTGRPVEIRFACPGVLNSATTNWTMAAILIGGVKWQANTYYANVTSVGVGAEVSMRKVLTAGTSYTFEVGVSVSAGTGTLAALAGNTMYLSAVER
jgi:hypothetical protein